MALQIWKWYSVSFYNPPVCWDEEPQQRIYHTYAYVTVCWFLAIFSPTRNGKSLGRAFDNVKTGPDVAYFPAVSLAQGENLTGNFGATPFRYPQPGFLPLEEPPTNDLVKAYRCVSWLTFLVSLNSNWSQVTLKWILFYNIFWVFIFFFSVCNF